MSFKLYLKYWTFCGSFVDWFFIKFHVFIFIFNNFFRIHAIQHWMWTEYLGIASILKWAFYLACWLCLIIQKKLQNLNIERGWLFLIISDKFFASLHSKNLLYKFVLLGLSAIMFISFSKSIPQKSCPSFIAQWSPWRSCCPHSMQLKHCWWYT